jgi:hypothetical protein
MKWIKALKPNNSAGPETSLDEHYGRIGISAVAAALRYPSDAKNLAYAPVEQHADERLEEVVA